MIEFLTLLSLILQFCSFWIAAPEVLGADWLKKTEALIRNTINKLPQVILGISGMISGIVFYHSIKSTVALIAIVVVMLVLMLFSKKIEKLLDRKISKPLMDKLILNDSFRFTLLKFSAVFFTIGFFIQLALEVIK